MSLYITISWLCCSRILLYNTFS